MTTITIAANQQAVGVVSHRPFAAHCVGGCGCGCGCALLRWGMRLRPAADGRQRHPTGDCSGHYEVLGCPMEFRKYEPDEYTEAEVEKLLRKLGKHMRDSPDEARALYGVVHQLAVVVSVVTHDDAKAHELFQTALSH